MNIYYTAKDIEEMAAKGIRQLEIGPGITLTDFARETAQQLDIMLVKGGRQSTPAPTLPAAQNRSTGRSSKYSKPSGCMHGSNHFQAAGSQAASANKQAGAENSNTVNRLIDLMGNVMKRGG
jgi:hypothetical protein